MTSAPHHRKEEHPHPNPLNKRRTQYPMYNANKRNLFYWLLARPCSSLCGEGQQQPPKDSLCKAPPRQGGGICDHAFNLRCSKPWPIRRSPTGSSRVNWPIVSQLKFYGKLPGNIDLQTSIIGGNPIKFGVNNTSSCNHWHADHLQPGCAVGPEHGFQGEDPIQSETPAPARSTWWSNVTKAFY